MIRLAAVGDLHFGDDSAGTLAPRLASIEDDADVFLIAGDLTRQGLANEAAILADELHGITIPVVTVLGNHDYHSNAVAEIRRVLEGAGAHVLEEQSKVLEIGDQTLGIAGVKGFGGGFAGGCGSDFGEPEMKEFMRATLSAARALRARLEALDTDYRVALLHYAPVEETLAGEKLEIYPFLGSYHLAEAVDLAGADLVLHGHAHRGREKGRTATGVPVRNVAQPMLKRPYTVYSLGGRAREDFMTAGAQPNRRWDRA